jgi:sugar phosphate isomerase/epimerase
VLARLGARGYDGVVVLEVTTLRAPSRDDRHAILAESLAFTRRHLQPQATPQGSA